MTIRSRAGEAFGAPCLDCGAKVSTKKSVRCAECYIKQKWNEKKGLATSGMLSHRSVKGFLIYLHGAACMECGWDKINHHTGTVPIELEHCDGDSENNKLNNLKLLCPNCHSLTATYKGANRGKGRATRRARYSEGKSY